MASDKLSGVTGELVSKLCDLLQHVGSASPEAGKTMKQALVDGLLKAPEQKRGASNKKTKDEKETFSADLRIIHMANVIRIFDVIDKMEKNDVSGKVDVWDKKPATGLSENEGEWHFGLGDSVKVGGELQQFKFMQKQTIGWKKTLANVYGNPGIVTGIQSKYENGIEVYFPNICTSTTIYAGILAKIENKEHEIVPSRWKVDDYVRTKKNKEIVKRFQARLPDISKDDVGKKGRVIAVTNVGIFVTFDESSSTAVNPALLQPSEDQSPIKVSAPIGHPKGFLVGSKVTVIRHMKRLIDNQNENGGWNWKMSSLLGKTVTITNIQDDGSLNVKLNNARSWRLNYESVFGQGEYPPLIDEEDIPFLPGDKVRIRLVENIKLHMLSAKVLDSTLEFLKTTAIVEGIDDDLEVVVKFNSDQMVHLDASSLRKASKLEESRFDEMEQKRRCLDDGDLVRLDVGPPKYVKDILSKSGTKKHVLDLLTELSTLLHFIDENNALIRYENGRQFRVKRKYLIPWEKIPANAGKWKPSLELLFALQTNLESCVNALHFQSSSESEDGTVDIFSISSGSPPTVCFKIASELAKSKQVMEEMRVLTEYRIESLDEHEAMVSLPNARTEEVHLILLEQTEETEISQVKSLEGLLDDVPSLAKETAAETLEQSAETKVEATPFVDGDPPTGQGFRFMPFGSPSGTIYLAYVLPGEYGTGVPASHQQPGDRGATRNVQYNLTSNGDGNINFYQFYH